MKISQARQQGFTLIELVVVIVMIGLLTAVAIPQFMEYRTQARISQLQALAGTIRATAQMSRAVFLAVNPTNIPPTINVDTGGLNPATNLPITAPIFVTPLGYPTSAALGIQAAIKTLGLPNIAYVFTSPTAQISPDGSVANCFITYDETVGDVNPTTGFTISGC